MGVRGQYLQALAATQVVRLQQKGWCWLLQTRPVLSLQLDCAGLAAAEQVDSSHQSCQGGDHKKQDEDDPVVVQHAFVGSRFLCWDHVGEVQHVAKGPADGGFSCLWKQLGMTTLQSTQIIFFLDIPKYKPQN